MNLATRRTAALLALLITVSSAHGQATPWKVEMRLVGPPTANGACTPIEINVRDASGKPPVTPDGKQVDWQDFDITLTQGAGPLKLSSNGRFLCATAPGATGVVAAKYPDSSYLTSGTGKGRTGKQLIPNVTATATLEVRSAGSAPAAVAATSPAPGASTAAGPAPASTAAPVARSPATGTSPAATTAQTPSPPTAASTTSTTTQREPATQPAKPPTGAGTSTLTEPAKPGTPVIDEATRIEAQKWLYQALVNDGYPPTVAALMTVRTTIVSQGANTAHFRQSLVGGVQRDLTIRSKPVASFVPSGSESVIALDATKRIYATSVSVDPSETGYDAKLEFFAPAGVMTAGLQRERWYDPGASDGPGRVAGVHTGAGADGFTGSSFQMGDGFGSTGINVQQASMAADPPGYRPPNQRLQQYYEEVRQFFQDDALMLERTRQERVFEAAERLTTELEAKRAAKELIHAVKEGAEGAAHVALVIYEVSHVVQQHRRMENQLKYLQRCAQLPLNPLARRARQEDPNYDRATVDVLDSAMMNLKVNSTIRVISSALNAGIGTASGSAGVGVATGLIAAAEDGMLKDVAEQDIMADAGKGVVPCDSLPARNFLASVEVKVKFDLTSLRVDMSHEQKKTITATGSAPLNLVTLPGGIPAGHKGSGRATYAYHVKTKSEARDMGTTGRVSTSSSDYGARGMIDLEVSESNGEVTVNAFANLESRGTQTSDDGRGNRQTNPIRGVSSHGFTCKFEGVDLERGGAYTTTTGLGNVEDVCTLSLEPS